MKVLRPAIAGGIALVVLAVSVAGAQPAAPAPRIVKIGVLTTAWSPWHSNTEGFRDGLKELGYVEGRNVRFELRAAQGDPTRLPAMAAELVSQNPDLLYCVAAPDATGS